jgi:hypothetical protein
MVDSTWKYLAYDRILEVIKNSTSEDNNDDKQAITGRITRIISFEAAVREPIIRLGCKLLLTYYLPVEY